MHAALAPAHPRPPPPWPCIQVPACYKHTPPRLQPGYLSKFKEETLFYIFYSMPQDEAQLIAADELYSRGWCAGAPRGGGGAASGAGASPGRDTLC